MGTPEQDLILYELSVARNDRYEAEVDKQVEAIYSEISGGLWPDEIMSYMGEWMADNADMLVRLYYKDEDMFRSEYSKPLELAVTELAIEDVDSRCKDTWEYVEIGNTEW
jgi:hypothetical protein